MNNDLTKGKPSRLIWRFCLPLFFSALVQQLYVLVDSLVAGRWIGETALAAVGNAYQVTLLYQALTFGAAMGVSVVISRRFGAGKWDDVRAAVSTALISTVGFCMVLSLAGLACKDEILRLMRTPQELFVLSGQYLALYTAGLLPMFLFQTALGIFAAMGDAKTPAVFLSVSSLANITLDLLLVIRFELGIAGIAWATLICQTGGALLSLILLNRRLCAYRCLSGAAKSRRFSAALLREMLQIALPVTLQQLIVSVGNVLIQANVNSFGFGVSAGYAAVIKLNNMAISGLMAFDKGMAAFSAQNSGANKPERIRSGRNAAVLFSVCFGIAIFAAFLLCRTQLISLFLRTGSAEATKSAEHFLRIVIPFYIVVAVKIACDGTLRGLGAMRELLIGTFADLSLRVGCGFLFASLWGSVGIWAAWPVGWVTGTILSMVFTERKLRRLELINRINSDWKL